jgi:hypothetical protein
LVISIDTETAFDKIQHHFMIKSSKKIRNRRKVPQHYKGYLWRIPRWRLEGGSRKRASYSEILERSWKHTLYAKPPRRGKTLTPPQLQPVQNIHFMLNGEIRRAPRLPVACAQTAWEEVDKVS